MLRRVVRAAFIVEFMILRPMEHVTPDIELWRLRSAGVCPPCCSLDQSDILVPTGRHLYRVTSSSNPHTVAVRFIGDRVVLTILRSACQVVGEVVSGDKVRLLEVQRGPRRHGVVTENLEYA